MKPLVIALALLAPAVGVAKSEAADPEAAAMVWLGEIDAARYGQA